MMNLEKLRYYLLGVVVIGIVFLAGIHIGRQEGRQAEREEIEANLDPMIQNIDRQIKRLKTELKVLQVIKCESGGRHEGVWGDHGKAYGLTQSHYTTFHELARKAGFKRVKWKSKENQIQVLRWAVEHGYGRLWTCYDKRTI